VVLAPILTSLFFLIGLPLNLIIHWGLIGLLFGVVWVFQLSFSLTKIRFKKPTLFQILGFSLVLIFFVVMFVSGVKDFITILEYVTYILVFCLLTNL
jgi:hypothetical protein